MTPRPDDSNDDTEMATPHATPTQLPSESPESSWMLRLSPALMDAMLFSVALTVLRRSDSEDVVKLPSAEISPSPFRICW